MYYKRCLKMTRKDDTNVYVKQQRKTQSTHTVTNTMPLRMYVVHNTVPYINRLVLTQDYFRRTYVPNQKLLYSNFSILSLSMATTFHPISVRLKYNIPRKLLTF